MDYAIKLLETEREIIIAALKNGKKERLNDLQQLDKALGWLRLLEEKQLDKANRYHLEPLPFIEGYGGFTNYRIAIDNETDDMKFWEGYKKDDGSHLLLSLGDYLLIEK